MNKKKFIAVFKKNDKGITKVDLLTGWKLDTLMENESYRQQLDFICPVGTRFSTEEYREHRKLD
jgi:hypothetical protein